MINIFYGIKKLLCLFLCLYGWQLATAQQRIVVEAGNAESLLEAISEANRLHDTPQQEWLYIVIPSGTYDLGERVLTTLTANHVALVGEGMDSTIIRNQPPVEQEGIATTATLRITGTDNYLQDLTLLNGMREGAGRAVCLQDCGTRTICHRVRMLSHQDTYYSDNETGQMYFLECEIHGTVDFICGAGDVYFDRCRIVTERRSQGAKGRCVIAAPRTSKTAWGYVFDHCTIENHESAFVYARGWRITPRCVWLHTTLLSPEKLRPSRFEPKGMRTIDSYFKEYGTCDGSGQNVMPASNLLTLTLKDEQRTIETVLSKRQARRYTLKNVFPDWNVQKVLKRIRTTNDSH